MLHRIRSLVGRVTGALGRTISGAILLREAARTSRRWQTYFARTAFSGVLMGVLLLGMWAAVSATRAAQVDTANLAWLGRGLFVGFSVTQTMLAIVIAPLTTASAIIEETDERTMEMLVLTPLRPGQILGAKVLSRIGVLITVVCGALPVMALVVNLGGVSGVEVLAVTVHTLTTVVVMASLGAFFALFTKSPALAMMASACFAVPFFILLPAAHTVATGDWSDAPQFSTFAAGMAKDPSALVTPLSFLPTVVLVGALATPLFQLKVSNADFRHAFSDQVWHTTRWLTGCGIWVATASFTLPFAIPVSWWLQHANPPPLGVFTGPVHAIALGWIWVLFTVLGALGAWAYLRVGMDVVDGIDGVFTGDGFGPQMERTSRTVGGTNPVWWREARPRSWIGTAAPIFVTWGMILLGVFQTGWWILPGGLLTIGAANAVAAIVFGSWLATRSVAEERRRGTLEVLLATTLPSESIVFGKLAGAALPTLPLLLLSLPLFALGVPHLHFVSLVDGGEGSFGLFARGIATWIWMVPVWAVALTLSLAAATRMARPQSAFSTVMVALIAVYGIPAVLARAFPEVLLVTLPARLIAPPLAGGFSWWQLGASMIATGLVGAGLLGLLARRMRGWIGAAAVLLVGLALTGPAQAAPPDPEMIEALEKLNRLKMVARPLADGISREGRFTTVWVRIENHGPGTVGTVSLTERSAGGPGGDRTYERQVELPDGADKELLLLFAPGVGDVDRTVELKTREGRTAVAPFRIRPTGRDDVTIGVVGRDPLGLPAVLTRTTAEPIPGRVHRPAIAGGEVPSRVVHTGLVAPESMPRHSAGWGALDWIVWPDADPSAISAGQVEALRAWVADGGHLLVTTSDTWRQVRESPLGPALPLVLEGQRDADVTGLASLLELEGSGTAPIAVGRLREGQEVWVRARTPEGDPLWVSAPYGLGSIHVVTADLGTAPLVVRGEERAWRRLLTLPVPGGNTGDQLAIEPGVAEGVHRMLNLDVVLPPTEVAYAEEDPELAWEGRVRDWLSNIPGVAPLPLSWLVAFSAVYLLAIGPLDYFVLRAIGRQPLTWITFPLTIVVFSAASLALTSYTKGSQAVVMRVEVVDLLPGTGLARGSTWLGVFSTRKTTLELTSGYDDAVLVPLDVSGFQNDPTMEAGGGPGRLTYGAETWTLAYARSDWTTPLPPLEVRRDGERSFVRNTLGFDLDAVGLSIPDPAGGRVAGWARLGPLASGAEIEIPAAPSVRTLTAARPDDPLEWALETFSPSLPSSRGAIGAEQDLVFVGVSEHPIEPIALSGLSPVERPLTVVRMPLPSVEIEVDLDRAAVILAVDPGLVVHWANVVCADEQLRSANLVDGQLRFDDVLADGCTLQLYGDLPLYEHPVSPGMRGSCRERDGNVVCTLESP